jgi:hypothetical protein
MIKIYVMNSKLTLRLDDDLIRRAKEFSEAEGKSLSKLVGDYFLLLSKSSHTSRDNLGPITRSLNGVLRSKKASEDDYHEYLEEKHL